MSQSTSPRVTETPCLSTRKNALQFCDGAWLFFFDGVYESINGHTSWSGFKDAADKTQRYREAAKQVRDDMAKAYNACLSMADPEADVQAMVEALERIRDRTLRDAEPPELRAQNENNYRDAHAALARLRRES